MLAPISCKNGYSKDLFLYLLTNIILIISIKFYKNTDLVSLFFGERFCEMTNGIPNHQTV